MKLRRLTPLAMIGIILLFVALFIFVCVVKTAHGAAPVSITGTLTVRVLDLKNRTSQTEIGIVPDQATRARYGGKEIPVHIGATQAKAAKQPRLLHGSRVVATGTLVDGRLEDAALDITEAAIPTAFGEQRTLIMNVTFSDKPTPGMTITQVLAALKSVSDFWLAGSDGKTWATGVATPWMPIASVSTTCDTTTIITQAIAAAQAAGYPTTGYQRLVVNWTSNACSWWGLSTVGGNPSHSFVNGGINLQVLGHELGHGLGLLHSHSGTCANGACANTDEYGDHQDIMGYSSEPMNAFQIEHLGWRVPIISNGSGTYSLGSWTSTTIQAVKYGDTYAEYRPPLGVLIRHGAVSDWNSSIYLTTLRAGGAYTDERGTRFIVSSTGMTAQVSIAGGGPTATPVPPTRPPATATAVPSRTPTAGPVGTFSDAFDRPDGPLGNGWMPLAGALAVKGNQAVTTQIGMNMAAAPLTGTDQTAAADFTSWDSNLGPRFGLAMRVANSLDFYLCYRATGGSAQVRLSKFTNGVEKILASRSLANPAKGIPFHAAATVNGTAASCTVAGVSVSAQVPAVSGGVGLYIWNKTAAVQQVADNYSASAQ